ncbi:MAG TPA: hypothetical protein VFQ61_22005, partial [Polyangiaceae bacterium]|nr:hypothetical protein [Polyangiaceae bacterium]
MSTVPIRLLFTLAIGAAAGTLAPSARALCDQSLAARDESDQAFFDARQAAIDPATKCVTNSAAYQNFDLWLPRRLQMADQAVARGVDPGGWSFRGKSEPCEMRFEWGKTVNAAALVLLGAPIGATLDPQDRPFHSAGDYFALIVGEESAWHDSYQHLIEDSLGGALGQTSQARPFEPLTVTTSCAVYQAPGPLYADGNDVAGRASVLVHEGWHTWQDAHLDTWIEPLFEVNVPIHHDNDWDARANTSFCGDIGFTEHPECDWYHPHLNSEFGPGELERAGSDGFTEHSVFQVQQEFLCDIADYSPDVVPASVRELAALHAKANFVQFFANQPPMFCGSTRPYWTKDRRALADKIGTSVPECKYTYGTPVGASLPAVAGANAPKDCSGTDIAAVDTLLPCTSGLTDCSATRICGAGMTCQSDADGACCRPACSNPNQ